MPLTSSGRSEDLPSLNRESMGGIPSPSYGQTLFSRRLRVTQGKEDETARFFMVYNIILLCRMSIREIPHFDRGFPHFFEKLGRFSRISSLPEMAILSNRVFRAMRSPATIGGINPRNIPTYYCLPR